MIESITIYSIVFIITCVSSSLYQKKIYVNNKLSIIFLSLLSFPPAFIAGIRYGIGVDYFSYVSIYFNTINQTFLEAILTTREPIFTLINYISLYVFDSEYGVFFVSSFLMFIFIFKSAENFRQNSSITWIIFIFLMVYYIESFNLVRQMLAVSVVFYGMKYILVKRDFKKFLFWIIIAGMIHNTAIVCLVFYFVPINFDNKYNKKIFIVLLLVFSLFSSYIFRGLNNFSYFNYYFSRYNFELNSGLDGAILRNITFVFPTLFFSKRLIKHNKNNFGLVMFSLISIAVSIIVINIPYGWRMSYYFTLPQLIVIPEIINSYKTKNNRIAISLLFILIYLAFFVLYYMYIGTGPGFPYRSIFD